MWGVLFSLAMLCFMIVVTTASPPRAKYEKMLRLEQQQPLGVRYLSPTVYEERTQEHYAYDQRIFWNEWGVRVEFRNDGLYDVTVLRRYNCAPQVAPAWNPISPAPINRVTEAEADALLLRIRDLPNPRVTAERPYSWHCHKKSLSATQYDHRDQGFFNNTW